MVGCWVEGYGILGTRLAGKSTMNEDVYFLLNMVIFQCHVSFQGCIFWFLFLKVGYVSSLEGMKHCM